MTAKLFIICSGTPTASRERFGSCLVLQVGSEHLMFDCGPAATYKLVRDGLTPTQIGHLFFTHHHYDHNIDYPCFLLNRWDHEREDVPRLKVFGPPRTELLTQKLVGPEGAFGDDIRARVEHPASQKVYAERGGSLPRPRPNPEVTDIESGRVMETVHCRVEAVDSVHLQPILSCLAYRVDWEGGSLVVTGDTARTAALDKLAEGAETMVVNVWDHQANMKPLLTQGFSGTLDAAEMAARAGVKRLVITHQGPNLLAPGSRERAVSDVAGVFNNHIIFSDEGRALDLD